MIKVCQSSVFAAWLRKLKDRKARARIQARIDRGGLGNIGDCEPVGKGISEMRIHYGPGYRVYFMQRGRALIVLLCGGNKGSQARDIKQAKRIAEDWRQEQEDGE